MLTKEQIIQKRKQLANPNYRNYCYSKMNSKQLNLLIKDIARGKVIYPINRLGK